MCKKRESEEEGEGVQNGFSTFFQTDTREQGVGGWGWSEKTVEPGNGNPVATFIVRPVHQWLALLTYRGRLRWRV